MQLAAASTGPRLVAFLCQGTLHALHAKEAAAAAPGGPHSMQRCMQNDPNNASRESDVS